MSLGAAAWDERYAAEELVWSREPNVFVVEHVADLAPGRALDLAGGEGRNAIWLAQQGWETELVEFSRVALDKAERIAAHAGVSLRRTHADVTDLPPLAPADLVLVAYLHLPAEATSQVLRWAAGLVAEGGTLLWIAHARRNLTDGVGGPPDPAVLRSPEEIVDALAGSGLALVQAGEVERLVTTDEGDRTAIDLLVRARRQVPETRR